MKPDDPGTVLERKPALRKAVRWCVFFHNDDYTTKRFVVDVLERFFRMDETTATQFMLAVHRSGRGAAGMYPRDVAETKVAQVMDHAREWEMPLLVTAEPEDEPAEDE
jgi:ATP-dependent Clp protease adaptor protein ClpS